MYIVKLFMDEKLKRIYTFEEKNKAINYFNMKVDQQINFVVHPYSDFNRIELSRDNFVLFETEV